MPTADTTPWEELDHADEWLIFPENVGPHVSIDETCLSTGEVYTIISNKDAHGRKGCIIAIVKGTRAKDVIKALKKIDESLRKSVVEVTLDFSESMRSIVKACFPNAIITLDRFHHPLEVAVEESINQEDVERSLMVGNKDIRLTFAQVLAPFHLHGQEQQSHDEARPALTGIIAPEVAVAQEAADNRYQGRQNRCQQE